MFWFLLGLVCGAIMGVVLNNAKPKADAPQAQAKVAVTNGERKSTVSMDIPIEVLPNIYSLSVAHPTVKYVKETYADGKTFEHICVDCELHYELNGNKAGKRLFVFSYYDQNGNVVSHSKSAPYQLTDSGIEIVHIEYYVPWNALPKRIGLSVQEVPTGKS